MARRYQQRAVEMQNTQELMPEESFSAGRMFFLFALMRAGAKEKTWGCSFLVEPVQGVTAVFVHLSDWRELLFREDWVVFTGIHIQR